MPEAKPLLRMGTILDTGESLLCAAMGAVAPAGEMS